MSEENKAEKWADKGAARVARVEAKAAVKAAKAEARATRRAAKAEARAARKAAKDEARAAHRAAKAERRAAGKEASAKKTPKAENANAVLLPELNISAKMRITLWFMLMVLLLSALVLVVVFVINGAAVTDNPAGRLIQVVLSNADNVEFEHGAIEWDELKAYSGGVYCTFYDDEGNVLLGAMPEEVNIDLPFVPNVVRTIDNDGEDYYLYDAYVDMNLSGLWIRGLISSEDHSGIMSTIILLTLILVPSLLLLTAGGGWLIANGAFKPMEKIIDAANDISDGRDLSARVALHHGPTEMKRLSRTFDAMFERLEGSFNAEKQFASDASHELRTPITVIMAECDRARRKDETKEDFLDSISVIDEQAHHMSELVQSLLGLTRMEHGTDTYPLRYDNLSEFVESCCNEFLPQDNRSITLRINIQSDIYTVFNPALMSRVVQNLMQNAYKYGRDNGSVTVSLKSSGNGAVFSVTDDGIGIDEKDQEKIWRRFWQADASRGEDGGSGLGLSMVKEIAKFHHGSVGVESAPGAGSTFTVTIPIKKK